MKSELMGEEPDYVKFLLKFQMLEIKYTEIALKQLRKISASNLKYAERIIIGIEKYANSPLEKHDIKHLKGKL